MSQLEYRWYEMGYFTPLGQGGCEVRVVLDIKVAHMAAFVVGGATSIMRRTEAVSTGAVSIQPAPAACAGRETGAPVVSR